MKKYFVSLFVMLVIAFWVLPQSISYLVACVMANAQYCNNVFQLETLIIPSIAISFCMFIAWVQYKQAYK